MRIKNKLKAFAMDNHIKKYAEHNAKELEKIADMFAIDFLRWVNKNYKKGLEFKQSEKYVLRKNNKIVMDEFSIKELLTIFKQEKNYENRR